MNALSFFQKANFSNLQKLNYFKNIFTRKYGIWEPDYLILGKTKTPEYDIINFQIKGYDFAVVEKYQSLIHKIAKHMGIFVENSWASPHEELKVQKYFPNSSNVENEYIIKIYNRYLQVTDVKSHIMSLFIEAVITACPPGVTLDVQEHTQEVEDDRYVPDFEVIELKKQLEEIGTKKKTKKKKF